MNSKDLSKRVKSAIKEINEVYRRHNLAVALSIRLPNHNRVPIIVRLCLWIVRKYGGIIDTLYTDLKK